MEDMREKMVRVDASLYAARNGYVFVRVDEYDKLRKNGCAEGHDIKTGYVFANAAGDEIVLGGTCQHKYMLFKLWENIEKKDLTPELTTIGEKFWLIERDGLWNIVYEIVQRDQLDVDFKWIPPKEDIESYKALISELHSRALAIYKAREKEKEERKKASEKTLSLMADQDYASIVKAEVPWNADLEYKRKDLLQKYERFGWTEKQRGLARVIASEFKRHNACQTPPEEEENVKFILKIATDISNDASASQFDRDFSLSVIRQRACLTEKQIPIAVRMVLGRSSSKNINLPFNVKDFLWRIRRK